MSTPASARLLARIVRDLPPGRLDWIGLRPERRTAMQIVDSARAVTDRGLDGDRRMKATPGSARQVTLIAAEHLDVIARLLGRDRIDPALLRRNLVVSGINPHALRFQTFRIGSARFRGTALCHPCSRMEENLGKGGHAAVLGHGGICAVVIEDGALRLGDTVLVEPDAAEG